jgi:hypothetical protein
MRTRQFRRVHLADVELLEREGWTPAVCEDGTRGYTLYDAGREPVVLVEHRDDIADALAASLERRSM